MTTEQCCNITYTELLSRGANIYYTSYITKERKTNSEIAIMSFLK